MNEKIFGLQTRRAVARGAALTLGAFSLTELLAQQPPAGGGGRGPQPITPYDDYTGFTKLWDGKSFNNWDGEMDVWSIEHDAVHADTTKTPGQHHLHYTGPGNIFGDFDLKVEMKMSALGANGGIQYRSRLLGPGHGGSLADPMGKNLPTSVHTLARLSPQGLRLFPPIPLLAVVRVLVRCPPVVPHRLLERGALVVRVVADVADQAEVDVVDPVADAARRHRIPGRSAAINTT